MLMIISFSVYYLAKSLQVFLLAGTATHLGLALKFYLSILFSVSSFSFLFFFFLRRLYISIELGESLFTDLSSTEMIGASSQQ